MIAHKTARPRRLLCARRDARSPRLRAGAFTLVELIAVIVVLSVLSAVVIPRFVDMGSRATASALLASYRAVSFGMQAYRFDYGILPPTGSSPSGVLNKYIEERTWGPGTCGNNVLMWWWGPDTETLVRLDVLYANNGAPIEAYNIVDQTLDQGDGINAGIARLWNNTTIYLVFP